MKSLPRLLFPALIAVTAQLSGAKPTTVSDGSETKWAVDDPVMMPSVRVDGSADKLSSLPRLYFKLDQLFKGPFLDIRGGQLIEAIVWRHRFLQEHPGEKAVLLVDRAADGRVVSATTIYTLGPKLYASNQVVGTRFRLTGMSAEDIGKSAVINARLSGLRGNYEYATQQEQVDWRSGSGTWDEAVGQAGSFAIFASGADSTVDFGDASAFALNQFGSDTDLQGKQMAMAEASGDYSHLALAAGAGNAPNPFAGTPAQIIARSFSALNDPQLAGIVPVAKRVMLLPTTHEVGISLINVTSQPKDEPNEVVVFDWEGVHYIFNPALGTYGKSIPSNPLTQQPYLCITGGDLLESIAFCAAYSRTHPDEKAVLIDPANGPYGAVYTEKGQLHYFSPFFGRADVPPRAHLSLADASLHARLLALLVERERKRLADAHQAAGSRVVPSSLPGDDKAMQAVRAYVALKAQGVSVRLSPGSGREAYVLRGSWNGTEFTQTF